jgi:hypothetical protein
LTRSLQPAILEARRQVDELPPVEEICGAHDIFCFAALADLTTGTMYTDLPGAFPVRSFRSMQYIFVAYVYDLNAILVRAMPSKNDDAMIAAFTAILATLAARDYHPTLNVMDNKCSKAVAAHIHKNNMYIHLVPPHNHRVNVAERAIATFKEHFIAGLATVDKDCLLQLWDDFLPQVELTLNLLRFSRRDPTRSANEEVYGFYDFNKTPIAPLGMKSLFYDDPAVRTSWAPHGTDAYYVGVAPKHYRCMQFFVPATRRYRIADTWRLYPSHCATPTISPHNVTVLTACDVLRSLAGTVPITSHDAVALRTAIRDLNEIVSPTVPTTDTALRVGFTPEPRVPIATQDARVLRSTLSTDAAPPVLYPLGATTSLNTMAQARIRGMRFLHQRTTRNNNPFATFGGQ